MEKTIIRSSYSRKEVDKLLKRYRGNLKGLLSRIEKDAGYYYDKWYINYKTLLKNKKIKEINSFSSKKRMLRSLSRILKLFFINLSQNFKRSDIAPPIYTIWSMLYQCNGKCSFCGYYKNDKMITPKPSNKSALEIMDNIILNSIGIYFCGGEPLLHPKLDLMVNKAYFGKMYPLFLNTNGLLAGPVLLDKEFDSGNRTISYLDYLIFSVHSLDPYKINKIFRSPGGIYDAVNQLKFIYILKRLQKVLGFKLMINTVIREDNINEVHKILDWAEKNEIRANFVPEVEQGPLINNKDYLKLAKRILKAKRDGSSVFGDYFMLKKLLLGKPFKCYPSVRVHIQINSKGDYVLTFPCIQKPVVQIPVKDLINKRKISLKINNKEVNLDSRDKSWWMIIKELKRNGLRMSCDNGSCYMAQNLSTELIFKNYRTIYYCLTEGILNLKKKLKKLSD